MHADTFWRTFFLIFISCLQISTLQWFQNVFFFKLNLLMRHKRWNNCECPFISLYMSRNWREFNIKRMKNIQWCLNFFNLQRNALNYFVWVIMNYYSFDALKKKKGWRAEATFVSKIFYRVLEYTFSIITFVIYWHLQNLLRQ